MKVIGIILLIVAAFNLIGGFAGGQPIMINGGLIWGVIGAYCVYRANKNKQEKEDKEKWENNSNN